MQGFYGSARIVAQKWIQLRHEGSRRNCENPSRHADGSTGSQSRGDGSREFGQTCAGTRCGSTGCDASSGKPRNKCKLAASPDFIILSENIWIPYRIIKVSVKLLILIKEFLGFSGTSSKGSKWFLGLAKKSLHFKSGQKAFDWNSRGVNFLISQTVPPPTLAYAGHWGGTACVV